MRTCEWCFGESDMPILIIPESPVLVWMEEKLIKIERDLSGHKLTPDEEWEILVYDEMVQTTRHGSVCTKCWKEDQDLYDKYYEDLDTV